jgi:transposase
MEASIIKRLCRQIGEQSKGVALLKSLLESEAEAQSPALFGMYRGFGFTGYLSARFAADLGDISRFDNEKQLVAWRGLGPSIRQSGSSVNAKGGISKRGSRTVRKVFHLASFDYIGRPGKSKDFADLEAYYRKKRRDGKHHHVAGVVRSTNLLPTFYYQRKDLLKETSE